jgi:spore germination protein PE
MNNRTAIVNTIYTTAIPNSSIFSIGDTNIINQKSKAIALQKEVANFKQSDNLYFKDYDIFKKKTVWLNKPPLVNHYKVCHGTDTIHVDQINLTALSLSSVFQVGSALNISADSRLKHFRILQGH